LVAEELLAREGAVVGGARGRHGGGGGGARRSRQGCGGDEIVFCFRNLGLGLWVEYLVY
jgi:hypothetical protein